MKFYNWKRILLKLPKQISVNPDLFPKSVIYKTLHKAIVDKNNYMVYRVNSKKDCIEIINFRGTKQYPRIKNKPAMFFRKSMSVF
jgi:hypothetical protein